MTAHRDAEALASAAAEHSGAGVDLLDSPEDLRAAADLFVEVWRSTIQDPPVSSDLMRALAHTGNYVAGAHRAGRLVAASVGFVAPGNGTGLTLHSHISAVAPAAQGASVGYALKLHQRAWALAHGITEITWTFDPLVRRNGWFNLGKLGAEAVSYHVDFYGAMSGINAGDPSDRLLVSWRLERPIPTPAAGPHIDGAAVLLDVGPRGEPQTHPQHRANGDIGDRRLCQVPPDIIVVRADDPAQAYAWRMAVREAMAPSLDAGFVATGMTRDGFYLLEPGPR